MTVEIEGHVEAGFERVRDAFAANFEERSEVGAACCIHVDGQPVVDIWAGSADPVTGDAWQRDTPVIVFSATKGVTAICIHQLVERGLLDLDTPVAKYWPEFGAQGKQEIPVRWVLAHRAGLADIAGEFTLDEALAGTPIVEAIAAQAPNWEPGSEHGYHVRSYGWILGELIRRVTGRSMGRYLAEEIAAPLGLQLWVGLPQSEFARCARLVPPKLEKSLAELLGPDALTSRALSGPSGLFNYDEMWNRFEVLSAEMPSSNGVANARSLSRLYAATLGEVDGVRVLAAPTVETARAVQSEGNDKVILVPTTFGLGFALKAMLAPGCGPQAFGHPGAGGSLAFGDPEAKLAFGYVMNRMELGLLVDQRSASLVEAVYASL